jgi:hypothetical protein
MKPRKTLSRMALKLLAPLAIALGGSLISSLLFPSRKDTRPPERQNFSDAGIGPINWGVGTFWCTPRVIAQSEIRESGKGKQRSKKGGGKPRCDVVLLICEGPIQGVTRILSNGKVMFDIRPGQSRNYLNGLTSSWTVLDGTQTTISPVLTSIVGASMAASLNGWALLVLEDLQLKDSGGSVPGFEVEVLRYPEADIFQGGMSPLIRQSAYFSPLNKTVSVKVVQCQDGLERVYNYTTSDRVYGARIEFQQGAGINNLAGDIALEAEGRISVHTSTGTYPITPFLPELGAWYDRGNEVTPGNWEVARSLEIVPYCVWDEALDGEVYQIDPTTLTGDYYPVPSVSARLPMLAAALHNQPLSLTDITNQLVTDFPESVGQWYTQIVDAVDPRLPGEDLFYGWTIDGQGSIFDSYSRLLASLGIDLVDNYGVLSYVSDNNRTLTQIQDDWVSRKYNDETGSEEPFYTYEIMPDTVSPDEIRFMFRDAGRDGEESLAYYRSPLFSETQNSETIATNAVTAFATAQTLAFRLFARTATRGKKYTVRLNYRAFGSIDIGSLIQFRIVDSDRPIWDVVSEEIRIDQPGWFVNRTVTLLVSEMVIDENFNMEIIGYEFLVNSLPQPTITPGDLSSPPDGLPDIVLMQARAVDVPIWDGSTNTLQRHHQAIVLAPGTDVVPSNESALSVLGGPYNVIAGDTPGDLVRTGTFTGGSPIMGVIDEGSLLTFSGIIDDGFGSVSESLFLSGQGTWLQVGTEVIRARNVTWNGTAWEASYLLRGLLGTSFQVSGQVTVLSKLKTQNDTAQDLGVTRDIRTYAGIQSITSTPAAPFTQAGFTATPYLPKNLGSDLQPNGSRNLYWQGHGLSNGVAINGQKPLNISIGQSYDIELIGAPGLFTATTQNLTLSSAQLGAATGFRVRQRGDFALIGGWTTFSF